MVQPIASNKRLFVDFLVFRPAGASIPSRYVIPIPICAIMAVERTMFNLPRLKRETGVCSWRFHWAFVAARRSLDGPSEINEPYEDKMKLRQNACLDEISLLRRLYNWDVVSSRESFLSWWIIRKRFIASQNLNKRKLREMYCISFVLDLLNNILVYLQEAIII